MDDVFKMHVAIVVSDLMRFFQTSLRLTGTDAEQYETFLALFVPALAQVAREAS